MIQENFSDVTQSVLGRPNSICVITMKLLNVRNCTGTQKIFYSRLIFSFLVIQLLYLKKWEVNALLHVSWSPNKGRV